jgi:predicted permease
MNSFSLDLRFALRQLARSPGLAAVALLSLATGIAGSTVMFEVLHGLLFQPIAGVQSPDEVARLYLVRTEGVIQTPDGGPGSYLDFKALRQEALGIDGVAAFLPARDYDYGAGSDARRVRGQPVSGRFFPLLGVIPARGRLLLPEDDQPGDARSVAVLSYGFWHRRFGGDPMVDGRTLLLNGEAFAVVGVASPEFRGIDAEPVDLWTPLGTAAGGFYEQADVALLQFLTRIPPASDRVQVRLRAETALAATAQDHPDLDPAPSVILGPLNATRGPHPSGTAKLAWGLWLATAMLLLIACANVANLLLARATTRRRELALRRALGAGESRIVGQLLTEGVLLALVGGAVGLALAMAAGSLVRKFPELQVTSWIDPWLVGFAILASLATGLLFGLAPAIQRARTRLVVPLNESHSLEGPAARRLPTILVAGQVALAVIVLVGAGLFVRALQKVVTIDSGMDLERLVLASLDLRSAGYEPAEAAWFYDRGLERLRALPGVEAVSLVMPLPLTGQGWGVSITDAQGGGPVHVDEGPYSYIVEKDFFRAAGIRILSGRPLTEEDRRGAEPVAVVSESLARSLAPGGDAVGICVPVGWEQKEGGGCTRIVGVAADVRHRYLAADPAAYVYRPAAQKPFREGPALFTPHFLIRTAADPGRYLGPIRFALEGLGPNLPYVDVQRLEAFVGAQVVRPFRIAARLLTLFGALALLLAAVGLYGTLAHFVADRAREVGVRMALGADRVAVVRMVVRRAMVPVVVGLAVGLAAAAAGARVIDAQLHGLSPRDPIAHALVIITLFTAALLATWLPARRAARLDPVETLKIE